MCRINSITRHVRRFHVHDLSCVLHYALSLHLGIRMDKYPFHTFWQSASPVYHGTPHIRGWVSPFFLGSSFFSLWQAAFWLWKSSSPPMNAPLMLIQSVSSKLDTKFWPRKRASPRGTYTPTYTCRPLYNTPPAANLDLYPPTSLGAAVPRLRSPTTAGGRPSSFKH